MPAQRSGSGGNGIGLGAHHAKPSALGVEAVHEVERDPRAEPARRDAEPGVADGVDRDA
jgi:hypothetical protein